MAPIPNYPSPSSQLSTMNASPNITPLPQPVVLTIYLNTSNQQLDPTPAPEKRRLTAESPSIASTTSEHPSTPPATSAPMPTPLWTINEGQLASIPSLPMISTLVSSAPSRAPPLSISELISASLTSVLSKACTSAAASTLSKCMVQIMPVILEAVSRAHSAAIPGVRELLFEHPSGVVFSVLVVVSSPLLGYMGWRRLRERTRSVRERDARGIKERMRGGIEMAARIRKSRSRSTSRSTSRRSSRSRSLGE